MPHVHNGLHEYNRLLDGAARAIGEKSGAQDFTGIERFGETLTPVMDLWALPEWAILRGEILFSRAVEVTPGATFGSIELVNGASTGVLAVVLDFRTTSAGTVIVGVDSGVALGASATTQGVANDTRFPQLGAVSRCTVVTGGLAATVALPQEVINTNNASQRPYIIIPGKKLMIIADTVNQVVRGSLLWTERPLLPTEGRA